ncbi:DUF3618 domain-containing protein [Nocardioides sp.]|uniref:DUF3618 domain-containing protein n=1 Tax=Nocardioides sp. TaxID=35761 RepID=UPI00356366C9
MSPTEQHNGQPTTQDLQHEIEQTRQQLGATVDALSEKLDVKTRTSNRIQTIRREHGQQILAAAAGVGLVTVALLVWKRRR